MIFRKNIRFKEKLIKSPHVSLSMAWANHGGLEIIPEQELSESEEHLKEPKKTNKCQKKSSLHMITKEKNRKKSPA